MPNHKTIVVAKVVPVFVSRGKGRKKKAKKHIVWRPTTVHLRGDKAQQKTELAELKLLREVWNKNWPHDAFLWNKNWPHDVF